jgi:hypothetical protein
MKLNLWKPFTNFLPSFKQTKKRYIILTENGRWIYNKTSYGFDHKYNILERHLFDSDSEVVTVAETLRQKKDFNGNFTYREINIETIET